MLSSNCEQSEIVVGFLISALERCCALYALHGHSKTSPRPVHIWSSFSGRSLCCHSQQSALTPDVLASQSVILVSGHPDYTVIPLGFHRKPSVVWSRGLVVWFAYVRTIVTYRYKSSSEVAEEGQTLTVG